MLVLLQPCFQPFSTPKALIELLPGNGIAESSVAHKFYTTPDAGTDENYTGDGTELYWGFDEERGRYYVSYPDDQQWLLLRAIRPCVALLWYLSFGSSSVVGL